MSGALKGPAFFAYADSYLIDVRHGVIADVEASSTDRRLIAREKFGVVDRAVVVYPPPATLRQSHAE